MIDDVIKDLLKTHLSLQVKAENRNGGPTIWFRLVWVDGVTETIIDEDVLDISGEDIHVW